MKTAKFNRFQPTTEEAVGRFAAAVLRAAGHDLDALMASHTPEEASKLVFAKPDKAPAPSSTVSRYLKPDPAPTAPAAPAAASPEPLSSAERWAARMAGAAPAKPAAPKDSVSTWAKRMAPVKAESAHKPGEPSWATWARTLLRGPAVSTK